MTKQKKIMYTIIFIVLFCCALIFNAIVWYNPSKDFNDMCKNVLAPSCQFYLTNITKKGKFEEASTIQKERIRQNKQVLNIYKRKITDKCLFSMTAQEAETSLMACVGKPIGKKDYYLLSTAQFTISDIIIDSVTLASIYQNKLHNTNEAIKVLQSAKKVLKQNKYVYHRDEAITQIDHLIKSYSEKQ